MFALVVTLVTALIALVAFSALFLRVQALEHRVAQLETERLPPPTRPPVSAVIQEAAAPPATAATTDWESIIGGNWLNKLGALLLVVGIGLFLAYSLAHLGPAGKVFIGFAVGLSMLAAGLVLEPRIEYATFARGFVGGGWAALYFTTYAMHALPAARVIESAALATALLLTVSALLVLHSLRYRSEPATILAYFISFITLNVTPITTFTVVASLLLAVSLMIVAYRFSWYRLAIAGLVFTYATFAITYRPLAFGLWIVCIYWLVFETYDLLDTRRQPSERRKGTVLFALNALGFAVATVAHEWRMPGRDWAALLTAGACAYAASAAIRARLLASVYQPASAVAAALAAAAIVARFTGVVMTTALFVEAELIVIAGVTSNRPFFERLGAVLLVLPVVHLAVDSAGGEPWTPVAAAMAASFYINYALVRRGWLYMAVGTTLLFSVLQHELEGGFVTVAWGGVAAVLVAAGFLLRDRVARLTGLVAFLVCVGRLFLFDLRQLDTFSRILSFIVLGLILLGASWVYTRYREQIRRIL